MKRLNMDTQSSSSEIAPLGADSVRFGLTEIYKDITDPELWSDLAKAMIRAQRFHESYAGQLSSTLAEALTELAEIHRETSKVFMYLGLRQACDAGSEKIQQAQGKAREQWSRASANYLTFFDQEVGRELSEQDYQAQLKKSPVIQHHKPYIDHLRAQAKHLLGPDVERALTLRAPYGPTEWQDYVDELEVGLRFKVQHIDAPRRNLSMTEVLNLALHHHESDVRFSSMQALNRGLKKGLATVACRALNNLMGEKGTEDSERGYPHIMAARNLENRVSDSMVDALHEAVRTEGAKQARRYYQLLARQIGKKVLRWSDRTARIRRTPEAGIPWKSALKVVQDAWGTFSPTLSHMAGMMAERGWVDAPVYKGKQSGAFNYSVALQPPYGNRSYTLMNYLGTERDIMTLAHEFGHGVHGLLAAEKQGPLLFQAPLAYAETASIFGEMLVFEHLVKQARTPEAELALLMEKSSDFINSVVRQIGFSFFEQRAHTQRKEGKLTTKDFCSLWIDGTAELYGAEGDIFTYSDIDYLWSYVSHFMNPFYVYAYAFGELLTQSLFVMRKALGATFEPKYLDLLRAGGSKDAGQLLAPFDLDPNDPSFWARGIGLSLGKWLDRAEELERAVASPH